jgi:hypothetical protein
MHQLTSKQVILTINIIYFIIINNLGETIGPYWGDYYTEDELLEKINEGVNFDYLFELRTKKDEDPLYLDGTPFCAAAYCNDIYETTKEINAKFVQKRKKDLSDPNYLTLKTTKPIKRFSEIYVSYGDKYWSKF